MRLVDLLVSHVKALIKINMSIHLMDTEVTKPLNEFATVKTNSNDVDESISKEFARRRYLSDSLTIQVAADRDVRDRADAESIQNAIKHAIEIGLANINATMVPAHVPLMALESPPPRDPEFMAASAEAANNPALRPSFQAQIETVKCPECGDQPMKIVDDDKNCTKCGKVVIPKPQPTPLSKNGAVAH